MQPLLTLDQIRRTVTDFFKDKPVKKVWLFGSYARGEADESSDLDLLVELDYAQRIGWAYYGWPDDLKQLFKLSRVDLVSTESLSKHTGPHILAERQLIYEEDRRSRAA